MRMRTIAEKITEENNQNTYRAGDFVRVSVLLEEGEDKETVIQRISDEVFPDSEWNVHNSRLAENMFTADIPYGKMSQVQAVAGVQEVAFVEEQHTTGRQEEAKDQKGEALEGNEEAENQEESGNNAESQEKEASDENKESESRQEADVGKDDSSVADTQTVGEENNHISGVRTASMTGLIILLIVLLLFGIKRIGKKSR